MKKKTLLLFGTTYVVAVTLFGLIPGTFFNYGYNYHQFLPLVWLAVPVLLAGMLLAVGRLGFPVPERRLSAFVLIALCALPVLFWCLRTQVHCFGGDGAVGVVASPEFALSDWVPPFPGKGRLDGYGLTVIAKCCRLCGIFNRSTVLTSILSTQVYAVLMGTIFALIAYKAFRRRLDVLVVLLTFPFVFNFFGNVDNYSFSLMFGMVFLAAFIKTFDAENVRLSALLGLGLLWGVGLWTHPFHVFWGFLLSFLLTKWLRQFARFRNLNDSVLSALFGLILFSAIKISPFGNHWFLWEFAKEPPTFSIDTLTHYLNMILLPSAPLLACLLIEQGRERLVRTAIVLFALASACFFTMAFTIGAVDQFNYQHLQFFIVAPLVVALVKVKLSPMAVFAVVICHLTLLIPLVAVHSTNRTIRRAEAVYPMDPCHHNRVMSWQTHLGLCLGDNLQDNLEVKNAVLRVFSNGARQAIPEAFRGGNSVYHAAFLYHFGEFKQGQAELYGLLSRDIQVIRWFLSERPSFIYCNRKRLWEDIDRYLVIKKSPYVEDFRKVVRQLSEQCVRNPYYLKKPNYAVTEF